jgi:hypothetical protein
MEILRGWKKLSTTIHFQYFGELRTEILKEVLYKFYIRF